MSRTINLFTKAASNTPTNWLLKKALDELPEEFREIIILHHLEGLSYKEIADVAQLASDTVMSRLAPTRRQIDGIFEDRCR